MVVAGLGVVLTTVYFVVAVRKVCQGIQEQDAVTDVEADEWVSWLPLVALTALLGLAPMLMLWSADMVVAPPVGP